MSAAIRQLTAIQTSLTEAVESAAGPTTRLVSAAGDEVSLAIGSLFRAYGQEFQAASAQATAFHMRFVRSLSSSATAYVNAELANVELTLLDGATAGGALAAAHSQPFSDIFSFNGTRAMAGNATPANPTYTLRDLLFSQSGAAAAAGHPNPYQRLLDNTSRNFNSLIANYRPFPVLNQMVDNQIHYTQMVTQALVYNLKGFPENLPSNVSLAVANLSQANLIAGAEQFLNGTVGFYKTLGTQCLEFGHSIEHTYHTTWGDLNLAGTAIQEGNYDAAVEYASHAAIDFLITGFDTGNLNFTSFVELPDVGISLSGPIGLKGPLGALLPILSAIGQQAQGTATIFPVDSIPRAMIGNFANGLSLLTDGQVFTDFALTLDLDPEHLSADVTGEAVFGLPLMLGFAALGVPFATLSGVAEGATAFSSAMASGNLLGAVNAIGNMPAYVLDGLLNGQVIVDQSMPVTVQLPVLDIPITIPTVVHLPLTGLLVDPQPISASVPLSQIVGIPGLPDIVLPLEGTKFGGLLPLLLNTVPQDFARAIEY